MEPACEIRISVRQTTEIYKLFKNFVRAGILHHQVPGIVQVQIFNNLLYIDG